MVVMNKFKVRIPVCKMVPGVQLALDVLSGWYCWLIVIGLLYQQLGVYPFEQAFKAPDLHGLVQLLVLKCADAVGRSALFFEQCG